MGLHSWIGVWHTAALHCPSPCLAGACLQQWAGSRTAGLHWEQGQAGNESQQEPSPSTSPCAPSSPCQPSPPTPTPAMHQPPAHPCTCAWAWQHQGQPRSTPQQGPPQLWGCPEHLQPCSTPEVREAAPSTQLRGWNRQDINHDSSAPPARVQERCHPQATQAGYATLCLSMAIFHHQTAPWRVQLVIRTPSLCPGNAPLQPMRKSSPSPPQLALARVQQLQF